MKRSFDYSTVVEAWGPDVPDWIEALGHACEHASQVQVAKTLGMSNTVVSSALRRKYDGDMAAVEARVRANLMKETLTCPALGEIGKRECGEWRDRAKHFSGHNRQRVQMYRACRRCPLFEGGT